MSRLRRRRFAARRPFFARGSLSPRLGAACAARWTKMNENRSIREIPYNFTSFSDREIVVRLVGEDFWDLSEKLRAQRRTGRSARMLFEVLGDIWAVRRNPYLEDDLLVHPQRLDMLIREMRHRIDEIVKRKDGNKDVDTLVQRATEAVDRFRSHFDFTAQRRKELVAALSKHTAPGNILFDGLSRVSHVTDATDWRVEYPFAVIAPDKESEVLGIVRELMAMGVSMLPRGGGTGYTGGAIPLDPLCCVINTEKLDLFQEAVWEKLPGLEGLHPVLHAGAGVVTRRLEEAGARAGLVFGVDPTSADASCVGGNIAMNAGGKKAVLWGTTLDNLLSWKMVGADGKWMRVERVGHNFGKIHTVDKAVFDIHELADDGKTVVNTRRIEAPGARFRKTGLGKDVTDKFLAGVPGAQKEGTDGIITSATFILHRAPKHIRTVCMEFFGTVAVATPAIVEIRDYLLNHETVSLAGLEHMDWRYVRAVGYATKAAGRGRPKMVLLADVVSDDEPSLEQACERIGQIARARDGDAFVAVTPDQRKAFWLDRSRTAAIARHTNAFKINEDVVIPLPRLGDYSDGIERINIELSIKNKLKLCDRLLPSLGGKLPVDKMGEDLSTKVILGERGNHAVDCVETVRERWAWMLAHLDSPIGAYLDRYGEVGLEQPGRKLDGTLFQCMRDFLIRVSVKRDLMAPLSEIFSAKTDEPILRKLAEIHASVVRGRVFVALHMHAGDGNVHTNIPVNSDDYEMLSTAHDVVDRVMKMSRELGGVISGEHGIGLTKINYLQDEDLSRYWEYKKQVDPNDFFNRGKLRRGVDLSRAYTPSFELLGAESLILERSRLGNITRMVKNCLRCGKCKPVCSTHVPRANLLCSPRNKILAVGVLAEAFLYEEQTRRGVSLLHFKELNEISDHCTVCHRCVKPCPVKIDFGDVSVEIRDFLKVAGQLRSGLPSAMAKGFLNATDPRAVKAWRLAVAQAGFPAQNFGVRVAGVLAKGAVEAQKTRPKATARRAGIVEQTIHFINRPLPARAPAKTARQIFGIEDNTRIPVIRDPKREDGEAVFYFPGCGSERLFSQISLAVLAMLWKVGSTAVLPPGYLCCGYPQEASGDKETAQKIVTRNRVLFHRVATTLNYLDIKTVLVSCGTCHDALSKYRFDLIFPGCRILDIHEYLLEKGVSLAPGKAGGSGGDKAEAAPPYLYHDPCHSPIKTTAPMNVVRGLLGDGVTLSDRCCGESGSFAVSRPDVATQVKFRKQEEIMSNLANWGAVRSGLIEKMDRDPAYAAARAPAAQDAAPEAGQGGSDPDRAAGVCPLKRRISDAVNYYDVARDKETGARAIAAAAGQGGKRVKILTTCPACLQGLSRYRNDVPIEADYIVIEMARRILGENWQDAYVKGVVEGNGVEQVLL